MNWVYLIAVVAVVGMLVIAPLEIVPAVAFVAIACLRAAWLTDWMGRRQKN